MFLKKPFKSESLTFTFMPYSDILNGIYESASIASFLPYAAHSAFRLEVDNSHKNKTELFILGDGEMFGLQMK